MASSDVIFESRTIASFSGLRTIDDDRLFRMLQISRLTHRLGHEFNPSFSKDNKKIIFASSIPNGSKEMTAYKDLFKDYYVDLKSNSELFYMELMGGKHWWASQKTVYQIILFQELLIYPEPCKIFPKIVQASFPETSQFLFYRNNRKNRQSACEIACRVIRTAKRLGIESVVAVYSDPDSNAQHVRMCNGPGDLVFRIGEAPSLKSYLRAEKIIEVAKQANVQAIHPGYGFLSENAAFAEACADAGIKFMGPPADAIRATGQKNRAKQIMIDAKVPVLPGYNGADQDPELLLEEAKKIGFPAMIKPVYGGGGIEM
ncbi:carbamoyl-phosphate synthase L chain, ATP binding domain-containing protein [Ditylenchus destructor]|uniref:Carbamoyl-phosphate synthase L chain, ATP binding domain-containing protein n=1 Tax=Ditylenchus destructor TaxID=166010 RepID=A0AAD4MJS6_9BILA|nr:carbamoyl-phosphate synthase L chain, ATP binding domain-containing protein [Ditylenchus destructor]